MNIVQFAQEILELAEERDYWRREAMHYKEMVEEDMRDTQASIKRHEETFAGILVAALDPDSGINRASRAIARDPLKGKQS